MCQFSEDGNADQVKTVEEITEEMTVQQPIEALDSQSAGSDRIDVQQTSRQPTPKPDTVVKDDTLQLAPPPGFSGKPDPSDLHLHMEGMTLEDGRVPDCQDQGVFEDKIAGREAESYPEYAEETREYQTWEAPGVLPQPAPALQAVPGHVVGTVEDFYALVAAGMPTPSPGDAQGPLVFWGPDEAGRFIGGPAHLLPGYFTPSATHPSDLPGSYPQNAQPIPFMSHEPLKPVAVDRLDTCTEQTESTVADSDKSPRCSSVDSGHDDNFSEAESTGFDTTPESVPYQPQSAVFETVPDQAYAYPCSIEPAYQVVQPLDYGDGCVYYDNACGYYDNGYMAYPTYETYGYAPAVVHPGYYGDQNTVPPFVSYQGYEYSHQ